jgi:glutathione synthase/RimK-type ligase-like ATP-grasp enzyme
MFPFSFPEWMKSEPDRIFARGDIEDADFIYMADRKKSVNSTQARIAEEADERGLNIKDVGLKDLRDHYESGEFEEIGEKLEGKKIFYRHNELDIDDEEDWREASMLLGQLESEYDVEFVNDPRAAKMHDNKNNLEKIGEYLEDIPDARVTEKYQTKEEIKEVLNKDDGNSVVVKPEEGLGGKGVELIESEDEVDKYIENGEVADDVRIEEYVDHMEEDNDELRYQVVDGELIGGAVKENNKDDEFRKNLNQGGEYGDDKIDEDNLEDSQIEALERAANGLGFAGIDAVKKSDELVILEVNATPGTKYEEKIGGLIDPVVDMMENDKKQESSIIEDIEIREKKPEAPVK